ncbi:hypothetical protein Agabi119p4_9247 [Agaricus bisporus var. burnettii]|uniref:Methyltransferase domain-containing protein n=1 Tax=Agaricus bisporus var. burnettii TaxID=192524 RepID=A0A8H7EXX3_AGABI|nr:hypothetical protein Agabi119p4_9247 [Agaricus bisporus var. burnettii]
MSVLNPSLLSLTEQEADFFKSQTKIYDIEELRNHIIQVQKKAYDIYPYPCIRKFAFTSLKIARLPAYNHVLELRKTKPGAILLDIGCCFGNDIRKAVADGWPVEDAIASDLNKEFWKCGHELFKSTPETFPAGFVAGDAFSSTMIEPREPFYSPPSSPRPTDLRTLTSLTPLQGHISAIHASSFFHLFNEVQQLTLAKQLATLLSPTPGSIIFGLHISPALKGTLIFDSEGGPMFCHSPETWVNVWDGGVFEKGAVKVEARIVDWASFGGGPNSEGGVQKISALLWSVTRL